MNVAIVYQSRHQGNTKKLVEAIAEQYPVTLLNAAFITGADLSRFDAVGFATGISAERVYPRVLRALREWLPRGKSVFFLYTCGAPNKKYMAPMIQAAQEKEAPLLGIYGCSGYYNFGPLRLFGGRRKGHPSKTELEAAVRFYENNILRQHC